MSPCFTKLFPSLSYMSRVCSMEAELSSPPNGPIADEHTRKRVSFDEMVECLAEYMLSSSRLPENNPFGPYTAALAALQREVWFCHWGIVVSLCVYQQLISHVDISVRESIAHTVGVTLAAAKGIMDSAELTAVIQTEFDKHRLTLKPDLQQIRDELCCKALHSTVVCYIRDMVLYMHNIRLLGMDGTPDAVFPESRTCIGRNFFYRFASVASDLLDILYSVNAAAWSGRVIDPA